MWRPAILLMMMIFIGILGYHIVEGWPILDCLYMTVITIFTMAFKEVKELSPFREHLSQAFIR